MRPDELRRLKAEVDHYIATDTTAMAPSVMVQPTSAYVEPEQLEQEVARLFRQLPLVFAESAALSEPGSFVAADPVGVPVVAIRQTDGTVRAFLNVCRHRGTRLVHEPSGQARLFTCLYHAWSYRPDGSLSAVPAPEGFEELDRAGRGLRELPCAERNGLIWVHLDPEADRAGDGLDVGGFLGGLDDELRDVQLEELVVERSTTLHEQANWKLLVDGFLESYHVRSLHPTLARHVRCNLNAIRPHGPHLRFVFVRTRYGGAEQPLDERFLRDVNLGFVVFPNTVILVQNTHVERYTFTPLAGDPGRCVAQISVLAHPDRLDDREFWDTNWEMLLRTVQEEDFYVSRTAQVGLRARAQPDWVFGRNEPSLQHYHRQLAAALST